MDVMADTFILKFNLFPARGWFKSTDMIPPCTSVIVAGTFSPVGSPASNNNPGTSSAS